MDAYSCIDAAINANFEVTQNKELSYGDGTFNEIYLKELRINYFKLEGNVLQGFQLWIPELH